MKIYVGNLPQEVTEDDLRLTFEKYGKVDSTEIIKDWDNHQSKGFGFVKMRSKDDGQTAIDGLNETELKGNTLTVNKAQPLTDNHGGRGRHGENKTGSGGGKRGFGTGRSGTRGDR